MCVRVSTAKQKKQTDDCSCAYRAEAQDYAKQKQACFISSEMTDCVALTERNSVRIRIRIRKAAENTRIHSQAPALQTY